MTLYRTLVPVSFRHVLLIAVLSGPLNLFAFIDIGVCGIISPVSGCGLGEEYIIVQVTNYGDAEVAGFPVSYQLDGGPVIFEVEALPLGVGDTMEEFFGLAIDLSMPGIYNLCVWTAAPDDDPSNDMMCITIESLLTPDVNLGPDMSVCDPTILDAGNPGATYSWSTGATTQTITVDETGSYGVTATYPSTGCSDFDSIEITFPVPPTAGFASVVDSLTYYFTNTSVNSDAYEWDFGDGNTSDEINPIHTYAGPGIYNLSLSAWNTCDMDIYSEEITLEDEEEVGVIDHNDLFHIYPNPAVDMISIETNSYTNGASFCMIDAQGQEMMSRILSSDDTNINVSSLPCGIYLFYITSNERILCSERLVIAR